MRRTALAVVAALALSPAAFATEVDPEIPEVPESAFEVTDASLRWGINNESQNQAFAPGTFNFLSAGMVPDPRVGGSTVVASGDHGVWRSTGARAWWAEVGNVRIEKLQSDGHSTALATFAGLSTRPDGTPIGGPTSNGFSGHDVVLRGGTGQVDPETGTAEIGWEGSWSVLYYSGMSFFTVTDPELVVTRDAAELTAVVAGYAASMDDPTAWQPVAGRRVRLADLPRNSIDLDAELGFAVTPTYRGVEYDAPGAGQVRSGADWGAFPSSFVDQLTRLGSGGYWYSTGSSVDRFKVPLPLTVSYAAGDPITPDRPVGSAPVETPPTPTAPPPPAPSSDPAPQTPVPQTPVPQTHPPEPETPEAVPATPGPPNPATGPPASVPPPAAAPPAAEATAPAIRLMPVATVHGLAADTPAPPSWQWPIGAAALLTAGLLTTATRRLTRPTQR
ncbi:hypothetical protein [Nocardioides limicola]|uniref:hypothetical protein n=1 Tax=Nocardioides limicola TaxID=2803368 RepID=UPI00193BB7EF|nr:hypothetical protein [Nocardioides sp. DJM-14]